MSTRSRLWSSQARKGLHMYSQLIDFFHVVCLCTSWPVNAEGGLVILKRLSKLTFDPECINMRCKAASTRHFDNYITSNFQSNRPTHLISVQFLPWNIGTVSTNSCLVEWKSKVVDHS